MISILDQSKLDLIRRIDMSVRELIIIRISKH